MIGEEAVVASLAAQNGSLPLLGHSAVAITAARPICQPPANDAARLRNNNNNNNNNTAPAMGRLGVALKLATIQ